jgi:TPR repeat protein
VAKSKTKAKKKAPTRKPAKQPAKKRPTKPSKPTKLAKQSGKPPTDAALLAFAKAGDCDGIFRALEPLDEEERDDAAYKWLAIASDFGHAEADEYMDGMLEGSSLRYDDDQMVVGGIHFELGAAYLTGTDGLDRDVEKARAHLTMARERHYPWTVQGTKKMIADLAKSAGADRALVDELFTAEPERASAGYDDDE